jgi:regulator of ribonuclease activity B
MKSFTTIAALLTAASFLLAGNPSTQTGEKHTKQSKSPIPREQIQQILDTVRQQTKWNIDGNMLWGYFFVDHGADQLKLLQRDLEKQGYRFVDLHEVQKDGRNTGDFLLDVEKVETHSVDSLDTRNGELDALAAKYGVREYDGMDVGPAAASTQPATTRPAE